MLLFAYLNSISCKAVFVVLLVFDILELVDKYDVPKPVVLVMVLVKKRNLKYCILSTN